jgi:hypothetical protein
MPDFVSSDEMLTALFEGQSDERALTKILSGSLSFDKNCRPFFTPARIELTHEIIHVLHNARGMNRAETRRLLESEQKIWSNPEEWWTIAAGEINENQFNQIIGAPDRYGHAGIPLSGLDKSSEWAQKSFKDYAEG